MVDVLKNGSYILIDPSQLDIDVGDIKPEGEILILEGEKIFVFPSQYGSGTFPIKVCGESHGAVDSDSGMIAVIPKHIARAIDPRFFDFLMDNFYGLVLNEIEFEIYVIPQVSNGTLRFGNAIEINTLIKPNLPTHRDEKVERLATMYLLTHMTFNDFV